MSRKSVKDNIPKALKAECLVRVKEENPEKLKERQEMVKHYTPAELGQISSLGDFPMPKLGLFKKR